MGIPSPRLTLLNSGSTARDHLASERTFLAYVRTSLALASTGVALVQLFTIADITSRSANAPVQLSAMTRRVQRFARPLGVTTVLLALAVLFIGMCQFLISLPQLIPSLAVNRYFRIQYALPQNQFPVARLSIAFVSFILGGLVAVVFAALLGGEVG